MARPAFRIATVTLHGFSDPMLTPDQRAAAEHTLALNFAVAKRITERQAAAHNRHCDRVLGPGAHAPIYGGWFTFYVNARGEYVDGVGEYGSRDEAIWAFHRVHSGTTPEDREQHRHWLGYPPSRMDA